MAYVVVGPRIRGKFNVQRAEELGVMPGLDRSRLAAGKTITVTVTEKAENGEETKIERTVKPEDVMPPPEEPSVSVSRVSFLTYPVQVTVIIDIPTPAHIASIVSSFDNIPFYKKYRSDTSGLHHHTRSVFHLLGEGVLEDERYVQWMTGWDDVQVGLSVHFSSRVDVCHSTMCPHRLSPLIQ